MEGACYALLFADRIITEINGKKGLIGVFSDFHFPAFPAIAPPWFIYAAVSNLTGRHEFSINLVRDESQQVVLPIAGEVNFPEPGRNVELIFPIGNLTFQKAGVHTLTFNIDGQQLGSRILTVRQADLPSPSPRGGN
jgi:hypothetical protein